jgi:hypothetical protein
MLFDRYLSRIESEIKQLEEKRRQFTLNYSIYQLDMATAAAQEEDPAESDMALAAKEEEEEGGDEQLRKSKRTNGNEKSKQSKGSGNSGSTTSVEAGVTNMVTPLLLHGTPYVVYSMNDYDIMEDWSIIQMHSNLNNLKHKTN